jgi:hypothetical protein
LESNNQRLTIFVVDFLNSSLEEQRTARQQLLKFLSKSLDMREPLSLQALDQAGVKVIHDFTTDPAVLAEALKKVTEQSSSIITCLESIPMPKTQSQAGRSFQCGLRRADLKVGARAGYYEGPPQEEKQQIKEEIETALNSPFDYTAVPLGVQWSAAKEASPDGKRKIAFMFVMAPGVATLEETE